MRAGAVPFPLADANTGSLSAPSFAATSPVRGVGEPMYESRLKSGCPFAGVYGADGLLAV